jgi:hypothetical protein
MIPKFPEKMISNNQYQHNDHNGIASCRNGRRPLPRCFSNVFRRQLMATAEGSINSTEISGV